jgi:hypothetical protein
MPNELNADEQAFFATGELPPALQAEAEAAAAAAAVPTPTPTPAPAPANEPAAGATPAPSPAPAPAPAPDDYELARAADRRQLAALQENLRVLTEQMGRQTQPPPEVAPDPEKDPLGHMMFSIKQLNQQMAALQNNIVGDRQQSQQAQEFNAFVADIRQVKEVFTKTTPDFGDAYQHLRAIRAQDMRDVGVPEDRIPDALMRDEIAVAFNAKQQGKNPAEAIYNMAKRNGYVPKAAPPAATPANLQARIEQIQNGQAGAAAPARGDPTSVLTFEGLKDASSSDLDKIVQSEESWHKLVGNTSHDIFG